MFFVRNKGAEAQQEKRPTKKVELFFPKEIGSTLYEGVRLFTNGRTEQTQSPDHKQVKKD